MFPGGKLDPADLELDMAAHLDRDVQALHAALREPHLTALEAAGLHVAALREAFEECGLLLAHGASQRVAELAAMRATQGLSFNRLLADLSLRLDTSNLVPWSRWITPQGAVGDQQALRHPLLHRAGRRRSGSQPRRP